MSALQMNTNPSPAFPSWQLSPSCAGDPKGTATGGEDPDET